MKDSFYFQHDYNAHKDEKVIDLRCDYGWHGYGVYWALIEMLAENGGYLEFNCKRIAFAMQTDTNCISDVIQSYNLFSFEGDYFYSERLLSQLQYRKEIQEKRKKAAEKRWHGGDSNANGKQVQSNSDANDVQDYAKERKGKESKEKEKGLSFLTDIELGNLKGPWLDYLEYRKEIKKKYKTRKSELSGFKKMTELSNKDPENAQKMVDEARANGWQGLFPVDENKKKGNEVEMTEQQYMALPIEKKRELNHPIKLWGSKKGEIKVCNKPGEAPKKEAK